MKLPPDETKAEVNVLIATSGVLSPRGGALSSISLPIERAPPFKKFPAYKFPYEFFFVIVSLYFLLQFVAL